MEKINKAVKDARQDITMVGVDAAIDHGRPWQVINLLKEGNFTFEDYVSALDRAGKLAGKYSDKSQYDVQARITQPEESYRLSAINPDTYNRMYADIVLLMEDKFGKEFVALKLGLGLRQ